MNIANIKFIITILAIGLLYPYKPAQSQWYNTIDQQQQNAVIQSQQEHLLRQQEAARQRLFMEQRGLDTLDQQQQYNHHYQRQRQREQQYNNLLHRGF